MLTIYKYPIVIDPTTNVQQIAIDTKEFASVIHIDERNVWCLVDTTDDEGTVLIDIYGTGGEVHTCHNKITHIRTFSFIAGVSLVYVAHAFRRN